MRRKTGGGLSCICVTEGSKLLACSVLQHSASLRHFPRTGHPQIYFVQAVVINESGLLETATDIFFFVDNAFSGKP